MAVQIVGLTLLECQGLPIADRNLHQEVAKQEHVALKDSEIESVLEYNRGLYTLSDEDLQREFSRAEHDFSKTHRATDRVRMILLLSSPRAPFKDYDRSLGLINDSLSDPDGQDPELADFLFILSSWIEELKNVDQEFRKEKKQREDLQQKLEELKAIEKNLLDRNDKKTP